MRSAPPLWEEKWGHNAVFVLLVIFYFANQFNHTTAIKNIAVGLAIILTIYNCFKDRHFIDLSFPLTWPTLLFLVVIGGGIPFSLDSANTSHDIYAHFIFYMVLWGIIVLNMHQEEQLINIMIAVVWGAAIFYSYCYLQQYVISADADLHAQRFLYGVPYFTTSLIGIHASFCINVALLKIFSTRRLWVKLLYTLLIILFVLLVVATETRNAILAIVVSLLVFLVFNNKKTVAALVVILFGLFLVISPQSKRFHSNIVHNERFHNYLMAIEVIKDHPLTGVGFGQNVYLTKVDKKIYMERVRVKHPELVFLATPLMHTHNLFLDIAVRTGIPGLLIFLAMLGITLIIVLQRLRQEVGKRHQLATVVFATICSICVIGLFEQVFHHTYEAIYTLLLAITYFLWHSRSAQSGN